MTPSHLATPHGIHLQQLRFAIAAENCRSFRRAADLMSVKHSVLSRSIRQLEHLIGVSLFERTSGGVQPTPTGGEVLAIARLALEQIDALVQTGKIAARGELGRLSVGFSTSLSAGNLRATILEFKKRYPGVEVVMVERPRPHLANALRSGVLDVAICPGALRLANGKTSSLWSERVLIALPEKHALIAQDAVYWVDLRDQTVILSKHDPGRELAELLIHKFLSIEERPRIERHDVSRGIAKSLVSMGLGVSLVLESDIGTTFAGLSFRELLDGTGPSRIGFNSNWRANNGNPALGRFLELLSERYPSPSKDA